MRKAIRNCNVAALAIALAFIAAGCSRSSELVVRKEFQQDYPIDSRAILSVANLNGSVEIRGSDLPGLEIHAVITATDSQRLNGISIDVKAREDRASIVTRFPPEKRRLGAIGGQVDYVLRVPRTMRISQVEVENGRVLIEGMRAPEINARVVDGSLSVQNCLGHATLFVSSGSLELSYDRWETVQFLASAQIIQGNARIVLPTAASLHLVADAGAGKVINYLAETVELNGRSNSRADMVLGTESSSEVNVRATMGDIEIGPGRALATNVR